jgi:chromosome partitioning protein
VAVVVSVVGLKGGVAKTATATALAAHWCGDRRVLLIDADPNGSALKWHRRGDGALGCRCVPLAQAPMALAAPVDLVLMDTAGGSRDEVASYIEGSDFVLAPCLATASSIEQTVELADLIAGTGKRYGVVLTMVDERRRQDATKARTLLEGLGVPVLTAQLSALSAWPKAEAAGVAVRDARNDAGRPDPGAARAWQQVAALAAEIEKELP